MCPPGYVDSNCSMKMDCKYWDKTQQVWSTEGVTTSLKKDQLTGTTLALCATTHLTTFGGILSIATSFEELQMEVVNVRAREA